MISKISGTKKQGFYDKKNIDLFYFISIHAMIVK